MNGDEKGKVKWVPGSYIPDSYISGRKFPPKAKKRFWDYVWDVCYFCYWHFTGIYVFVSWLLIFIFVGIEIWG